MRARTDLPAETDEQDAFPPGFHQSLFPAVPEPPFEDPDEQERVWGARWGANGDGGRLGAVLMRRPGRELERIDARGWGPRLGPLADSDEGWYWESDEAPDLDLVEEQYRGLVAALGSEGVV